MIRQIESTLLMITLTGVFMLGKTPVEANSPPATRETCVAASCHAAMGKAKFVHGPVAVGDCTSCHALAGKHAFKPIKDAATLCASCHPKAELTASHLAHKQAACTKCHDPHQSDYNFQLRSIPGKPKK